MYAHATIEGPTEHHPDGTSSQRWAFRRGDVVPDEALADPAIEPLIGHSIFDTPPEPDPEPDGLTAGDTAGTTEHAA